MAKLTRGIDHVGIVVPDIDEATDFLKAAFGAEVIYDSLRKADAPVHGIDFETVTGVVPGATLRAGRMIALEDGPDIELFEMIAPDQRAPARGSDFGLTHFALYALDMTAAIERFTAAGGTMLTGPQDLLYAPERGKDDQFCYGRTPWGMLIEFITYPNRMPYRDMTSRRRWDDGREEPS